jgi:hypothetical protein
VYFVYIRGGSNPPSRVLATWTGYKKAGPILFSTEHRGFADGKPLHIFISDVAVRVTGSDTWMDAKLRWTRHKATARADSGLAHFSGVDVVSNA